MSFNCSQHQCYDCQQKTSDAGGLIFRCRWCERGFCEDCLDWDKTELIGENLKEYELLEYPSVTQAYYICCPSCTDHHASNPAEKTFCDEQAADIDMKYRIMLEEQDTKATSIPTMSDTQSMTDASTLDDSAVATPFFGADDGGRSSRKKRKAAPASFKLDMISLDDSGFSPASPFNSDDIIPTTKVKRKVSPESKKANSSKRFKISSSPF